MTPEEVRTLFDYNAWANHRSLEAAAALSNNQFTRPLSSRFGFGAGPAGTHLWRRVDLVRALSEQFTFRPAGSFFAKHC